MLRGTLLPERVSPPLSSDATGLRLLLLDQRVGWRESVTRLTGLAEAGSGDTWKQAHVHVVCRWWVALTLVRESGMTLHVSVFGQSLTA